MDMIAQMDMIERFISLIQLLFSNKQKQNENEWKWKRRIFVNRCDSDGSLFKVKNFKHDGLGPQEGGGT